MTSTAARNSFPIFSCHGRQITTLEEWRDAAPPAGGSRQWRDGRSAKELARRWVAGRIPEEIEVLLASNEQFARFTPEWARAETQTRLDDFPGNTRNQDLVVLGQTPMHRVLLDIEGKADEEFNVEVQTRLSAARQTIAENPRSNALERVHRLSQAIIGVHPEAIGELRYQLLYGTAAALIRACEEGACQAAFIVHEFRSPALCPEALARNAGDLAAFVRRLGKDPRRLSEQSLIGPFFVPGNDRIPGDVALFIGKAVVDLV
jgi:hypothetical protein